jgi:hypothetical protein
MTPNQPAYPFYTRYGIGNFYGYLNPQVKVYVSTPESYYPRTEVRWDRCVSEFDGPRFEKDGRVWEELVTRDEFMAAYNNAESFAQAAARDFLPTAPIEYATGAQTAEIKLLLNHPAFNRAAKTKWLLRITRLTEAEAGATIKVLTDTRAMFDGLDCDQYGVVAEVFRGKFA